VCNPHIPVKFSPKKPRGIFQGKTKGAPPIESTFKKYTTVKTLGDTKPGILPPHKGGKISFWAPPFLNLRRPEKMGPPGPKQTSGVPLKKLRTTQGVTPKNKGPTCEKISKEPK